VSRGFAYRMELRFDPVTRQRARLTRPPPAPARGSQVAPVPTPDVAHPVAVRSRAGGSSVAPTVERMQSHDLPGDGLWSPIEWARQAYQRGDRFFQIDLVVSVIKVVEDQGVLRTQTVRPPMLADHLGLIEDQGRRLEQVSTSYVMQGTSTAVFGIGEATRSADHGSLVALYVFRRQAASVP
jgi:hypothetical protein